MDGGIDRAYREFFGAALESRVREWIQRRPEGRLPIGEAIVVPTDHSRIPYLIVAPTITMPECVDANACYRATKAALRAAAKHPERIAHVFCPGMATGVGGVPPKDAAEAMAEAWRSMDAHGFPHPTPPSTSRFRNHSP